MNEKSPRETTSTPWLLTWHKLTLRLEHGVVALRLLVILKNLHITAEAWRTVQDLNTQTCTCQLSGLSLTCRNSKGGTEGEGARQIGEQMERQTGRQRDGKIHKTVDGFVDTPTLSLYLYLCLPLYLYIYPHISAHMCFTYVCMYVCMYVCR